MGAPNSFLIAPKCNFVPKFGTVVTPRCGYFTSGRRSKYPFPHSNFVNVTSFQSEIVQRTADFPQALCTYMGVYFSCFAAGIELREQSQF
jgi:hypothetical protein